jgi:CubicO group peptidase (beta-lactamase class C family)/Tol biopolymer transport system component
MPHSTASSLHASPLDGASATAATAHRFRICCSAALTLAVALNSGAQPASARPSQDITFSTTTGTWISLDVTPDGRTILFELAGDIYRLPITGGDATRITSGSAFDAMPRVAPNGNAFVFISDRDGGDNLWLAAPDGSSLRQLSHERGKVMLSPSFSPDGASIVVTITVPGLARIAELWRFDVATGAGVRVLENRAGNPSQLNATPAPGPYGAAVLRDNARAITAMVTPRAYGDRSGTSSRLLMLSLSNGRSVPFPVDGTNPSTPVLSPNGDRLAYGAQFQGKAVLRLRDLTTGNDHIIVPAVDNDELESRATRDVLPRVAFTPDGSAIIAAYAGQIHRIALASDSATVIPFRAQVQTSVPVPPRNAGRVDTSAVTARIFQQIAIASSGRIAVAAFAKIWVTDAAGARVRLLTRDSGSRAFFPAWSRDAARVAYATWNAEGGALWLANADGNAAPAQLTTDGAFYADPAFSADGSQLLAIRAPAGTTRRRERPWPTDAEFVVINIATRTMQRIAPAGNLRQPTWSSDGARILAFGQQTGVVAITIATGAEQKRAFDAAAPTIYSYGEPSYGVVVNDASQYVQQVGDSLLQFDVPAADTAIRPVASGATVLSADAPETLAASPDGQAVAWATGTWVHRQRITRTGTQRDSVRVSITVPRASGRGVMVLRGATAITMRGTEVIRNADIIVRDHRIESVGPRADVPAGARVLDLTGHTVVPGYIDTHAHWGVSPALIEPDATAPWANLAQGVTTARDPSAVVSVFGYADMAAAGIMPSARLFSTGPALFSRPITSYAAVQRTVNRYRDRWHTPFLKMYMSGDRQTRRWIADAAAERGMLATTEGGSDMRQDMTHVLDGFSGNEHTWPATPLQRDAVQLLAQSRIAYTPTLLVAFGGPLPVYGALVAEPPSRDAIMQRWTAPDELYRRTATRLLAFDRDDYRLISQARDAAAVHNAGGLVAVGGHGESQGLSFHWEMRNLTLGGISNHDVLRMATRNGAEALGVLDDLGTLEPGKLADLVILTRDPLTDISNARSVRYVMRNGELFDATTLARIWPTPAAAPIPWWQREAQRTEPAIDVRAVDATVTRFMQEMRVPGTAVAIMQHGQVVLSKGYGSANLETGTSATPLTMFQSGSLGKMFTAAGVLALMEDNKIALDSSVRVYLPEAPPSWQRITIRHLLSHTGGLADYTGDQLDYHRDYTDAELLTLASALPQEFPAGLRWNYSNTGYVVLGLVITRVAGKPYWEFLRERIFAPAGMPRIQVQTDSAIVPERAQGYEPAGNGWRVQRWVSPSLNRTGDGSMLLSLDDMIAWNDAVRRRAVLRPESWAQMFTPVTLTSGAQHPYGFAWFADSAGGQTLWQHGGAWQGFRTQFSRYALGELDIVVLANSRTADPAVIAAAIAAAVDPRLAARAEPSTALSDPDTAAAGSVRRVLARAVSGALSGEDFSFARATIVTRMSAAAMAPLRGAGALTQLELLQRRRVGDDRLVTYRATFSDKRFRVQAQLTPENRPSTLRVTALP